MKFQKIEEIDSLIKLGRVYDFELYISAIARCGKIISYEYRRLKRDKRNWQKRQETGSLSKESIDNFQTRWLSITTSYILTICSLEDIFEELIKKISNWYCIHMNKSSMPLEVNIKEQIETFRNGISDYRFYRNKIYAHTAYIKPKSKDTELLKDTTIQMFATGSMSMATDGYFILGGVAISHGPKAVNELKKARGTENFHEYTFQSTPPRIDIIRDFKNIKEHFRILEMYCCDLFGYLYEIREL